MPTVQEFERWYSATQAGETLGVSRQAVHKMLHNKRLRYADTAIGVLIDPVSVHDMRDRRRGKGGRAQA
jgi:predicted transcriptional regulator